MPSGSELSGTPKVGGMVESCPAKVVNAGSGRPLCLPSASDIIRNGGLPSALDIIRHGGLHLPVFDMSGYTARDSRYFMAK
jgi:hypothetical protein